MTDLVTTLYPQMMKEALIEAQKAWEAAEIPVGAVIFNDQGDIIARAYNQTITLHEASAHAEILCLREAGRILKNYRLLDLHMAVTLEPCAMCAMALIHSRLKTVGFGAHDYKTGACGSVFSLITDPRHNHHLDVYSGIMAEPCSKLLKDFFKMRRRQFRAARKALREANARAQAEAASAPK